LEFPTVRAANSLVVDQALRGPEQLLGGIEALVNDGGAFGRVGSGFTIGDIDNSPVDIGGQLWRSVQGDDSYSLA
jgi:hypothetical protein